MVSWRKCPSTPARQRIGNSKGFLRRRLGSVHSRHTGATHRQTRLASGVLAHLARAARTLRSTPEQGRGRCSTPTAGLDMRRRTGYGRPARVSGSGKLEGLLYSVSPSCKEPKEA